MAVPFILIIELYRKLVSPIMPPVCRYYPSCYKYSMDSLKTHGVFKGMIISSWRIMRCNPFSIGGPDEVPPENMPLVEALKYYKKDTE